MRTGNGSFVLDQAAQGSDPNVVSLFFYPRSHAAADASATGQAIHDFIVSRTGTALLVGAVLAAPSRPPVVALEPFLVALLGDAAFTDEMKKYTGRLIRQVIEHLGGSFVRRSVRITVPSRYGSGSIYSLSSRFAVDCSDEAVAEVAKEAEWAAKLRR